MTNLSGRVAVVTGSARGIGKAIAERYGSLGASVVVNFSNNEKAALDTAASIERSGGKAVAIRADVSKVADIERLFAASLEKFGRLDIAVANAGVELAEHPLIAGVSEETFDRVFAINAKGAFFTLQCAGKHVVDNGRIIYVGSSTTGYPMPGLGVYGGSKIAAQYFVEVLAKELGPRGVTVNSILPTATEGAGIFGQGVDASYRDAVKSYRPMARMGSVRDVADAAEYFASDLSSFVSGQHLLLSGGANR
ncbi:MAG TPA: SDR family oxidoreductase [Vicinamibacterales bacterium]|jgi:3-oxoacyl-[acyl-carrier protein] reductase|nr:SDR family oxidoreductase [Vicinamibacterales bacterium]